MELQSEGALVIARSGFELADAITMPTTIPLRSWLDIKEIMILGKAVVIKHKRMLDTWLSRTEMLCTTCTQESIAYSKALHHRDSVILNTVE